MSLNNEKMVSYSPSIAKIACEGYGCREPVGDNEMDENGGRKNTKGIACS